MSRLKLQIGAESVEGPFVLLLQAVTFSESLGQQQSPSFSHLVVPKLLIFICCPSHYYARARLTEDL